MRGLRRRELVSSACRRGLRWRPDGDVAGRSTARPTGLRPVFADRLRRCRTLASMVLTTDTGAGHLLRPGATDTAAKLLALAARWDTRGRLTLTVARRRRNTIWKPR